MRTQQTPPKLTSEQLSVLQQIVEANNDATLDELRYQLEQQTGVLISRSTLDRMLKKLNLTVKKTLHVSEKNTERVQSLRAEFWQLIPNILAAYLIFIDESGVNLSLVRLESSCPQRSKSLWSTSY